MGGEERCVVKLDGLANEQELSDIWQVGKVEYLKNKRPEFGLSYLEI